MGDSPKRSPFSGRIKGRQTMMELRSRNVPRTPTPEKLPTSPKDLPVAQNEPLADSSSSQDVDDGENEEHSRRSPSVEPQNYEEHSLSLDQSTSRRNSSYTESNSTLQQEESPKKQPKVVTVPESKTQSSNFMPLLLVIAAVVICLFAVVIYWLSKPPPVKFQHCDKFVTELRPKYPTIDPMLWTTLNVSVNRALYRKPGEPSTFIFLYDSSSVQKSLVEDVVAITSRCFDGTRPIRLTNADFETPEIAADYGAFLQQYKRPLEERGIMVVQNLDQVPAKAARALFTICDSYGPLVERAVIFFTIDISQLSRQVSGSDQSPTEIAENLLRDQWRNGLKGDTLVPLLVRLTENVFKIM